MKSAPNILSPKQLLACVISRGVILVSVYPSFLYQMWIMTITRNYKVFMPFVSIVSKVIDATFTNRTINSESSLALIKLKSNNTHDVKQCYKKTRMALHTLKHVIHYLLLLNHLFWDESLKNL